jgi:hypothetical protein
MKMMILIVQMTTQTFFDAFKDSSIFMRRDVDFIYELAENTTRLILDEELNEDTLAAQV